MSYQLTCQGATGVPEITGTAVDACTTAGGTVAWIENASFLPELSLADGGLIAGSIIALWALAWAFRQLAKQINGS
jgi:hypothetical protein